MSTTNNRRPQPGRVTGETIALFVVIGFVLVRLLTRGGGGGPGRPHRRTGGNWIVVPGPGGGGFGSGYGGSFGGGGGFGGGFSGGGGSSGGGGASGDW